MEARGVAEVIGGGSERVRRLVEARERDKALFAAQKQKLEDETQRRGLQAREDKFDATLTTFDDALSRRTIGLVSKSEYGRIRRETLGEAAPATAPTAAPAAAEPSEKQRAAQKRKAERERAREKQRQRASLSFGDDEPE